MRSVPTSESVHLTSVHNSFADIELEKKARSAQVGKAIDIRELEALRSLVLALLDSHSTEWQSCRSSISAEFRRPRRIINRPKQTDCCIDIKVGSIAMSIRQ